MDELPGDNILAVGELSAREFAEVVRIVGDRHVPNGTRSAFAQGLVHYMDAVGDAATNQSDGDFARPDIVALVAEIGGDETAVDELADVKQLGRWNVLNPL